jgi:hypothetical protein
MAALRTYMTLKSTNTYQSYDTIGIDTTLHIITSCHKDKNTIRKHSKHIPHIHRLAEYTTGITATDGAGNISPATTTRTRTHRLNSTTDIQETWSHRKASNIQYFNNNIQYINILILILII